MTSNNPYIEGSIDIRRAGMSGIQTRLFFKGKRVGAIQAISWTTQRETGTIYEMGDIKPVAIASGKEGYGGSIVLAKMHGHDLLTVFNTNEEIIHLWQDQVAMRDLQRGIGNDGEIKSTSKTGSNAFLVSDTVVGAYKKITEGSIYGNRIRTQAWTVHQLPPLDLVMVNSGEHGQISYMKILGIKFVNSGSSSSIDDIVMSESYTYICTDIIPWTTMNPKYSDNVDTIFDAINAVS